MTITFSPSPLAFGNVATSSSVGQNVTITNTGTQAVTLSLSGSGFTMSPSSASVPAFANGSNGSCVVTITFLPTAQQGYSGTLTGGGASCTLSGTGVDPASLTGSGTDPNNYESEFAAGASADTGRKYYQVTVPNFALNDSTSTPGNSFFRLGSFPSLTATASYPAGFSASLSLAKLIGDAQGIQSAEAQDLDPETNPITPSYKGDSNYMLGFSDDTRYRKGDTSATWQARRDATRQLLTKGGWWDHSDGNRISTTAGDKIEIIQGNYKMMVLGRQTVSATPTSSDLGTIAANTLITDISGGLMVENGPSPTHCIKSIEYIYDDGSDTWEVYQNNGIGKVFSSFYGDTVDIFLGQHKATFTGNAPSDYTPVDDDDTNVYNVYKKSLAIRTQLKESLITDDPAVMDHMWASKILDYKRVSGDITSDVQASNITSRVRAKPDGGGRVETDTVANSITTTQTAATITNVNTAFNHFNFAIGALMENINLVPLTIEIVAGAKLSLGLTRTRVYGNNNTVDASSNIVAANESKLAAIRTAIQSFDTTITNLATEVENNNLTVADANTVLGTYMSVLATQTLLA